MGQNLSTIHFDRKQWLTIMKSLRHYKDLHKDSISDLEYGNIIEIEYHIGALLTVGTVKGDQNEKD